MLSSILCIHHMDDHIPRGHLGVTSLLFLSGEKGILAMTEEAIVGRVITSSRKEKYLHLHPHYHHVAL